MSEYKFKEDVSFINELLLESIDSYCLGLGSYSKNTANAIGTEYSQENYTDQLTKLYDEIEGNIKPTKMSINKGKQND